jgi:cytochrome c-type biogenesis protein CcmH
MPSARLAFASLRIQSVFRLLGIALCLSAIAQPYEGAKRVRALSDRILAPCCWREAVSVHQSPAADTIRQRIADEIASGRSDGTVMDGLIRDYGKRILREPEGFERWWLYLIPASAVAGAGVALLRFLRRSASMATVAPDAPTSALPDIEMYVSED